jgi:hypothetical protein
VTQPLICPRTWALSWQRIMQRCTRSCSQMTVHMSLGHHLAAALLLVGSTCWERTWKSPSMRCTSRLPFCMRTWQLSMLRHQRGVL